MAASRLVDPLRKAAGQLAAMKALPGLVVLDCTLNMGVSNLLDPIQDILKEPWAQRLAGVAVLTQMSIPDEGGQGSHVHNLVGIVPGPLQQTLTSTLLPSLLLCEQGHWHYDTLLKRRLLPW